MEESARPHSMLLIEKGPHPLIRRGEDGKLCIDYYALEELKTIETPSVVMGIIGTFRSGKSYLMNRIAGIKENGFRVESSHKSQTEGIWIWVRPHPFREGVKLILLDNEGIGDPKRKVGGHGDFNIFSLATLVSSTLIYNTKGLVSDDTISQLSCVTELAKKLVDDESDLTGALPSNFVVALRDFDQCLKEDGKELTSDQYLEGLLNDKDAGDETHNWIRECIKRFFTHRKCFLFECPGGRNVTQNLSNLGDDQLSEDFVKEMSNFLSYILKDCVPEYNACNGPILANLITRYVSNLNEGNSLNVKDTIVTVIESENRKHLEEKVKDYVSEMEKELEPYANEMVLEEIHEAVNSEIKKAFTACCCGPENLTETSVAEFEQAITQKYEKISEEKCEGLWVSLYNVMSKKSTGEYRTFVGYQSFLNDLNEFEDEYKSARLGPMSIPISEKNKPMCLKLGELIKERADEIDAKEHACFEEFKAWYEIRKDSIKDVRVIKNAIQEEQEIYRIGQITYSSVGLVSAGLGIAGIIAAPFTFGASLGLTIGAIATGVASGTSGIIHKVVKDKKNKTKLEKVIELLEKDKKAFESLQNAIEEVKNLSINENVNEEGFEFAEGGFAVGQGIGRVGAGAFHIANLSLTISRIAGKVIAPVAAVLAVIDIAAIVYFSKKVHTKDLCEMSAKLREQNKLLKKGLKEVTGLVREALPRFFKDFVEDKSVYNSSDDEGDTSSEKSRDAIDVGKEQEPQINKEM